MRSSHTAPRRTIAAHTVPVKLACAVPPAPAAEASAPTTPLTPQSHFETLPDSALVRESMLVCYPGKPLGVLPFGRTTLWRKVADGTFPAPIKISTRVTAWRVGTLREWLRQRGGV